MTAVCKECLAEPSFDKLFADPYYLELLDECDYCGKKGEQVALVVSELSGYIMEQVGKEYTDPANELPYETREGGYQGDVFDNPWDLFAEIEFELKNPQVMEDLCECLGADVWLCRQDYFALEPHQRLRYGWRRFCDVINSERRYTFLSAFDSSEDEWHPDYFPTAHVLKELAEVIGSAEIVKPVGPGASFWRARIGTIDESWNSASDFAAPPTAAAIYSNRMSPAGISMFYGADSVDTAIAEVTGGRPVEAGKAVYTAVFKPARNLHILDLADLPAIPSFFDDRDRLRHALYFLIRFQEDVSKSVQKDGREHIEYVPTQAFSEFIRYELRGSAGDAVDGIGFKSATGEGVCYVIFADHEQCLPESAEGRRNREPLLVFDASSVQRFNHDDPILDRESKGDSQ